MKSIFAGAAVGAVLVCGPAPAAGQAAGQAPPPAVVRAPIDCRGLADGAARLRCYDAAVGALAEATRSGTIVVLDRSAVRRTKRSLFGFDLPDLPFFGDDEDEPKVPKELIAKVKSARPYGHLMWLMELETGAAWQTMEPTPNLSLPRAGDEIKIRKAVAGGYMLQIGQQFIRTKRVR
ncbi:MAG TPA: hypothetical protein VF582_07630 [Allosphingosinicella sp.]|jgi:hypothetical protein